VLKDLDRFACGNRLDGRQMQSGFEFFSQRRIFVFQDAGDLEDSCELGRKMVIDMLEESEFPHLLKK
jgi:hypothetical protein